LKELGSPSTRWVKKPSLNNIRVIVFLLLPGSESVAKAEQEQEISKAEGEQEGSLGIQNLKEKMFSK